MKLYFNDREFQAAGFSTAMINTMRKLADFVDAQNAIEAAQADIDANATDITALAANDVVLDGRIDIYDALAPFVRQDQTTAWANATGTGARTALSSYAGTVMSNPPTQAEVQALDDAFKAHSQAMVALINDLRGISALT